VSPARAPFITIMCNQCTSQLRRNFTWSTSRMHSSRSHGSGSRPSCASSCRCAGRELSRNSSRPAARRAFREDLLRSAPPRPPGAAAASSGAHSPCGGGADSVLEVGHAFISKHISATSKSGGDHALCAADASIRDYSPAFEE